MTQVTTLALQNVENGTAEKVDDFQKTRMDCGDET